MLLGPPPPPHPVRSRWTSDFAGDWLDLCSSSHAPGVALGPVSGLCPGKTTGSSGGRLEKQGGVSFLPTSLAASCAAGAELPGRGALKIKPSSSGGLFFFFLLGLHPWHMEVPRLGVELEL